MRYHFGDIRLDTETMEFSVGGEARSLEPQVFDVLATLVEHRDRVISRDELIERVWGGRVVSDATIDARISAVRKAIGDSGKMQSMVKTIARRGFRFVATLVAEETTSDPVESRLTSTMQPSIMVQTFQDHSEGADKGVLAEGLTADITTALAKLSDMVVIDRTSAMAVGSRAEAVSGISKDSAVRYILTGTFRRSGQRLRVTVQLIDTESGRHLWAERYDGEIEDIFDVQDSITEAVVTALQVTLTEGQQAAMRRRHTESIAAWQHMAYGLVPLRRFTPHDNLVARQAFERAIEEDAGFGPAWGMLALTHLVDARLGYADSAVVSLEQGAALAEKGLSIDPNDPDTLAVLGAIRLFQRRFEDAELASRLAVERGPNLAEVLMWRATVLNYTGRAEEALRLIAKAMRLSPYFPDWFLGIQGVAYRCLRRFEEAIAADLARLKRNPDNPISDFRLAAIYAELGRHEEACAQIAALLTKNPKASIRQVWASEPYQNADEMSRYLDLLRTAGLPE